MAIWQFVAVLIPIEWAESHCYDSDLLLAEDGYESEVAWLGRKQQTNYRKVIGSAFAPASSWHKALECWGDEKETDVQVWTENGAVSNIQLRIDVRRDVETTLSKAVCIARDLCCVFFLPEQGRIIQATEKDLHEQIRISRAGQFVADPKLFLEKIALQSNSPFDSDATRGST